MAQGKTSLCTILANGASYETETLYVVIQQNKFVNIDSHVTQQHHPQHPHHIGIGKGEWPLTLLHVHMMCTLDEPGQSAVHAYMKM